MSFHRLPMVAQPSAASAALRAIALMVVLVFGALVAGAGVALVGVPFTAVVAGVVLGGFALFVPLTWLLWLMFGLTFVVVGAAQYFGGVSKGFWAPYLLGALLMLRVPMERYRASTGASSVERRPALPMDAGLFSAMVALFFIIALASTLFNLSPWLQVFVSAKEYLFLWSICFLVAAGHAGAGFERRIWLALLWLAPLQVPVVLYQRFVVAVSRQGSSAWDAVVGLFGGKFAAPIPSFPGRPYSIVGSYTGPLGETCEMMDLVKTGKIAPIPVEIRPLDQARALKLKGIDSCDKPFKGVSRESELDCNGITFSPHSSQLLTERCRQFTAGIGIFAKRFKPPNDTRRDQQHNL